MSPWLKCAILGMLQGLTEFFPVSSSGHLVLGQALLRLQWPGVGLEVTLHLASVAAIIVVLRREVGQLVTGFFGGIWRVVRGVPLREAMWAEPRCRQAILIILASVPAGVAGLTLNDVVEAQFEQPAFVAMALLLTGLWVGSTRLARVGEKDLNPGRALLVGLAQAVAILPGVSRSGATIATGMWAGLRREEALRFSFLLFLPAGLGAALLKTHEAVASLQIWPLAIGFLASFVVSSLALLTLLHVVRRGQFHRFAVYCWALGILALSLHLGGRL